MQNHTSCDTKNQASISWDKIIGTFFSIILIRIFFDSFAFTVTSGNLFSWQHAIHAFVYFCSLFLSFSILLFVFTKKSDLKNIFIFVSKIAPIIFIVPIIDFLIYKHPVDALYVTINSSNFLKNFLQMGNPFSEIFGQATFGIYIAASVTILSFYYFVYKQTKSSFLGILSMLAGFLIFFLHATIASFIILFNNDSSLKDFPSLIYYYILNQSWLWKYFSTQQINGIVGAAYEIVMARIFWIFIIIETSLLFYLNNKGLWDNFKKNMRLERIFNYVLISFVGILISQKTVGSLNITNPINILTLVCFILLITFNAWLAVFINDAEDTEIDRVSNPDRPLVKNDATIEEWRSVYKYIAIIMILGIFTMNKEVAFLLVLWQCAYFLYSSGSLRLKKHFVSSSLIMGFTTSITAIAGFFLVSPDKPLSAFPIKGILIISFVYILLSNIKDLKDYEGDKKEGIRTIPVVFGLERSKKIISAMYAIVFISIPFLLEMPQLLVFGMLASVLVYLILKRGYHEKYVFYIKFIYMLLIFFLVI